MFLHQVCQHSSAIFPVHNELEHGDVLSQLAFNFVMAYAIRKVQ